MQVSGTPLFYGLDETEIASLLDCLGARRQRYKKGETILAEGSVTEHIGFVLSGSVLMSFCDMWGNNSILGNARAGSVFAEAYACIPGQPLLVTASAAEDTDVLFIHAARALTACARACAFHARFIRNLFTVCACRNLELSRRIRHTGAKSIRGRLFSYFSECARQAGSSSFVIPYNRQQLADYLNVDRSALCHELSKMRGEAIIEYNKNRIVLRI